MSDEPIKLPKKTIATMVLAGVSILPAIYLAIAGAATCLDNCLTKSDNWRNLSDAWQWDLLVFLGFLAMFSSILSLIYAFSIGGEPERVLTKQRVGLLLAVIAFSSLVAGFTLCFY